MEVKVGVKVGVKMGVKVLKNDLETDTLTQRRCTKGLQSFLRLSPLTQDCHTFIASTVSCCFCIILPIKYLRRSLPFPLSNCSLRR